MTVKSRVRTPMKRSAIAVLATVLAVLSVGGCASDTSMPSGLYCNDGAFFLDGEEFDNCGQCTADPCHFASETENRCEYPNGVQVCRAVSGTVVATCGEQQAELEIVNGDTQCM